MKKHNLSLLLLPLFLMGCSETRSALGIERKTPDEFAVVDRAPLVMPPSFDLRPPQPGAPRPQDVTAAKQAETALLGQQTETTPDSGNLEQQLLVQSGAAKTTPDIRSTIDREAAKTGDASRHLADDLLWWRKPEDSAAVVDAAAEKARLQAAQQTKKSPTSGATPIIEKRKAGWLGL